MSDSASPKRFIGIIAGTSLEGSSLLSHLPVRVVATTSGSVSVATDGSTIAFVRRHHAAHSDGGSSAGSGLAANEYQHPDKINYAAIASALHSLGVTHVIAACSVGSLKPILSVGSLLVPSDYFAPWCCVSVHADKRAHIVPQLDPYLRALLLDAARESKASVAVDGGVYVQTQGPRFETKAEISFLQGVGDVVGMTGAVEAAMMQEVGLPYAMICCVDNMANGITCPSTAAATPLTLSSFTASAAANRPSIELVMSRAIALLSSPTLPSPAQSSPLLAACDIMIHCGIVLPVVPHRTELRAHSIIIRGNAIADLLPTPDALARYSAVSVSDMKSHIVMPGLVNLHTHAAMKLMKGVGSDVELMPWLQQFIWPLEAKLVCHDYVYDGTRLALAEMLLGGTTCINDMYFYPRASSAAVMSVGARAVVGVSVIDFPNSWGAHPDDAFTIAEQCMKEFEGCTTLKYSICPHAPYTVSDAVLVKCLDFQREHGLLMHSHMHETLDEVENSAKGIGAKGQGGRHLSDECCRPLANYQRLGLLSDSFVGAHCVHCDSSDIELLKTAHCSVASCPVSNSKLACGIAPLQAMIDAGVNVGIGTDGSCSNNSLDMFGELKTASLLQKLRTNNATALDAHTVIRCATLNGAKALKINAGAVEAGRLADLIAIDCSGIAAFSVIDAATHVAFSCCRDSVTHVRCSAKELLEKGEAWNVKVRAAIAQKH